MKPVKQNILTLATVAMLCGIPAFVRAQTDNIPFNYHNGDDWGKFVVTDHLGGVVKSTRYLLEPDSPVI